MIITYLGGEFIKVQFGETVLAVNPPSKDSKLKASRFGADVALVSLSHQDFNGIENLTHGERKPFVISGPGAYEVKGIVVQGFATDSTYGGEKKINTVYTVSLEGMKLCFLGVLSSPELPAELKEELGEIDVLFVPIGGEPGRLSQGETRTGKGDVLTPAAANKLAVALEPRLVIPLHFEGLGDKNALKQFLKESGEEKTTVQDKLTLKKKDLEGKEGEVIVLKTVQ
ncbi:MAG: hypothetical protein A2849_00070 [Candidatus Taylorbacteria bacterium RIFCSPHIGHO2_01_FULL_51_15]|uniref:Lactamase n=1 Tax=Candidatus Taylorbacteria bacterium RIFCSPHIGHO2_01_FULL_51_15 TaxID=1802304 RepID=A0A1G2MBZ2_9BACT|nr:MAG: hypothetical protein A2849_00070 [Candidatus Taylorbacteria bacterium RIFCSPHIGHO2_01_FULL_51_15]